MAIPGVGLFVAVGWLAATAVGVVAGAAVGGATGGIIGALADPGVSEPNANVYAEGIRRGGTLVSARVSDERVQTAEQILGQSTAVDLAWRRQDYEAEGWAAFDPAAPAYTPGEARKVL